MSRHTYTTYTLVNPIIQDWNHGNVDSSDSQPNENSMTILYEAVWYDRGAVEAGADGNPKAFGDKAHYDVTPSPITLQGGGAISLGAALAGGIDLFNYAATGKGFSSPLAAAIAGVNLIGNIRDLSLEGIQEEATNIILGANESFYDNTVNGLPNTQIK